MKNFKTLFIVHVGGGGTNLCRGLHVDIRGQLEGVGSLFLCVSPRVGTQVIRLGGSHFQSLSHLTGPGTVFFWSS